jgi:hypothetical protein
MVTKKSARKKENEIQDLSEFIRDHMVTKSDLENLATKNDLIALDTRIGKLDLSIHREVETVQQELKNVGGFGKEIDHALERIAAIEKHLGINKKIAAQHSA